MSAFIGEKLLFEEDHSRGGGTVNGSAGKSNRYRIGLARGSAQVVLKVTSTGRTRAEASKMLNYITRDGDEKFYMKDGVIAAKEGGDVTLKNVLSDWQQNFSGRKNAINIAHIVMSAPAGTDPKKFMQASLQFGQQVLGKHVSNQERSNDIDDYNWGVSFHGDTRHPHAHFLVTREKVKGIPLHWNKRDLFAMREAFAEIAKQHGIDLVATNRFANLKVQKSESLSSRKQREREGSSYSDRNAAKEVLLCLSKDGQRSQVPLSPKEAEAMDAMRAKMDVERKAFNELAKSMSLVAHLMHKNDEITAVDTMVKMLRLQAMSFRKIQTRHEKMVQLAKDKGITCGANLDKNADKLAQEYRASLEGKKPSKIAPISEQNLQNKLVEFEVQFGKKIDYLAKYGSSHKVQTDSSKVRVLLDQMLYVEKQQKFIVGASETKQYQKLEREIEQQFDDLGR